MSIVDLPPQKHRPVGKPIVEPSTNPHPRRTPPPPTGRRTRRQKLVLAIGSGLTAVLLFAAFALSDIPNVINGITDEIGGLLPVPVDEPANWLLVGSDSREGINSDDPNAGYFTDGEFPIGKRTDTIIIARVDSATGTIEMLPVPRDLWVEIDGAGREGRVNSAFVSENGEERLIATIQNTFGIEIHHYAEINFAGFQRVVDELGGVSMWFDAPMRDPASGLFIDSIGCHNLDGVQALAFARSRTLEFQRSDGTWQTDTSGDLGRISRQQHFLKRVVDATSQVSLTDFDTLLGLRGAIGDNLTISDSMNMDGLFKLAKAFNEFGGEEITSYALPVVDFRTPSRAAVLAMKPAEANQVLAIFRGEEPEAILPEEATVELRVLNGSRTPGQAKSVEGLLGSHGFEIIEIDNGPTTDFTTLTYGPGFETAAERVARYLEVEPRFEPQEDFVGLTLLTGIDFDGVRADPLPSDSYTAPRISAPVTAEEVAKPVVPQPADPVGILPDSSNRGACS
jgi:LCP family protein required for cell wall assembly